MLNSLLLKVLILMLAAFSLASASTVTVNCVSDLPVIDDRAILSSSATLHSCPGFNVGPGFTIQTAQIFAIYNVVDDQALEIRSFGIEVLNSNLMGFTSLVTNEGSGLFEDTYGPIIGNASNVNSQAFGSSVLSIRALTFQNRPLPQSATVTAGIIFTTDKPESGGAIPEPSTFALFAGALGGLALWRRR